MGPNLSEQWFYSANGRRMGPVTAHQLKALAARGDIRATDTIWRGDGERGVPAAKVKGLFPLVPSAPQPQVRDLFISYSSRDKLIADAICAALEREKVRCWIAPRDILPGVPYAEGIIDAIHSCRLTVIILSAESNRSPQVVREVERSVSRGMPIIPFRIEDVKPSKSMEYFLSAPHWLDALTPPIEAHIAKLIGVVRAVLDQGPAPSENTPAAVAVGTRNSAASQQLSEEFAEYRRQLYAGRGSVVFLRNAAPTRYAAWRAQAEAGDPIAQLFVGRCHQEGLIVRQDHALAMTWLEKSADQGNDFAMHSIGLICQMGECGPADTAKALQWYTKAAEAGNPVSMTNLGRIYSGSNVGKPNPERAFSWFLRAANAGYPSAMRIVGNCYRDGDGVAANPLESEAWCNKAADAGDSYLIGWRFGNRLAPLLTEYLSDQTTQGKKNAIRDKLRKMQSERGQLDLVAMEAAFGDSDLPMAASLLGKLKSDDPVQVIYNDLLEHYIALYQSAARSQRTFGVITFSKATREYIERRNEAGQYETIAEFWEKSFQDIHLTELNINVELNALVSELRWSATAMIRVGNRKEAAELIEAILTLCDRCLQEHPWDWYTRDAYSGLCFDAADAWNELGEPLAIPPLLRRGWEVRFRQYGREDLLAKYPDLPMRGKSPAAAAKEDKEFFERFEPDEGRDKKKEGTNKKQSFMKKFSVPVVFGNVKSPFDFYVITGKRGYAELQDQFRWVKFFRGGDVPPEVRENFRKINKLAVDNDVDFMELCAYAIEANRGAKD